MNLSYLTSIQLMNAHRIETALTENGKLSLQKLPFKKGDEVEIIILDRSSPKTASNSHPLRGTVIRYDNPFEPIAMSEN
jgi:hypothetical protein